MAEEEHTESFATVVGTETGQEGAFPIVPCFVAWWPLGL